MFESSRKKVFIFSSKTTWYSKFSSIWKIFYKICYRLFLFHIKVSFFSNISLSNTIEKKTRFDDEINLHSFDYIYEVYINIRFINVEKIKFFNCYIYLIVSFHLHNVDDENLLDVKMYCRFISKISWHNLMYIVEQLNYISYDHLENIEQLQD